MNNQTSPEELTGLLKQYEELTATLNRSIDSLTKLTNEQSIAKAEVTKNKYSVDLIKEQIMCAKKLIDASK